MFNLSVKCAKCNEKLDLSRKVSETVYHCPTCGLEEVTTDVPNLTQKYVGAVVCELCNRIAPIGVKDGGIFKCTTCGDSIAYRKKLGEPFIPKIRGKISCVGSNGAKLLNGLTYTLSDDVLSITGEGGAYWEKGSVIPCAGYSTLVLDERISHIGNEFLKFSKDLEIVYAPGVTVINASAFRDCYSLRRVVMPKLRHIYREAFSGCRELYRVEAADIEFVGVDAFKGCYALEHVSGIPCKEEYKNIFKDCINMSINLEECRLHLNNSIIVEGNFELFGMKCLFKLDSKFNLLQKNHIGNSVVNVYNDFDSFLVNQNIANFQEGFETLLMKLLSTHTGEKINTLRLNTHITEVLSVIYGNYLKIRTL